MAVRLLVFFALLACLLIGGVSAQAGTWYCRYSIDNAEFDSDLKFPDYPIRCPAIPTTT